MPRRGWSAIATSGWYEVIRGLRPLSVQWPLAAKGTGKGKGKEKPADRHRQDSKRNLSAASKSRSQAPQLVHAKVTITPDTKVGRLEAALKVMGTNSRMPGLRWRQH